MNGWARIAVKVSSMSFHNRVDQLVVAFMTALLSGSSAPRITDCCATAPTASHRSVTVLHLLSLVPHRNWADRRSAGTNSCGDCCRRAVSLTWHWVEES